MVANTGGVPLEIFDRGPLRFFAYRAVRFCTDAGSCTGYVVLVTSDEPLAPPTTWVLHKAYPLRRIGYTWTLSASSCGMRSGDYLYGHPKFWRSLRGNDPPGYPQVKRAMFCAIASNRVFPADTALGWTVGVPCGFLPSFIPTQSHEKSRRRVAAGSTFRGGELSLCFHEAAEAVDAAGAAEDDERFEQRW